MHRKIHTAALKAKSRKVNGKYITADFINLTKHYIFEDIFNLLRNHSARFGDVVICLDRSDGGYWRNDYYTEYKYRRKQGRAVSEIDFEEVFVELNEMIDQIRKNLPWKVVEVSRVEADDIMLVLSRNYNSKEQILIYSPDKDMIQAQRKTKTVFQFSAMTNKWIVPESKSDSMDEWLQEHICLGDGSDDVPRVVDHTEFSDNFLEYLQEHGYSITNPLEFKNSEIPRNEKVKLIQGFGIYKTNRKGESTGIIDIYKSMRFGITDLRKGIKKFGSIDGWLDSHPLYRANYERNRTLVMEEAIPTYIQEQILKNYKEAGTDYNQGEIEDYLRRHNLRETLMELPNVVRVKRKLTAGDFDW